MVSSRAVSIAGPPTAARPGIEDASAGRSAGRGWLLFAIPRTVGWLAQWEEMLLDPEQKIARPRQTYTGSGVRHLPEFEKAMAGAKA